MWRRLWCLLFHRKHVLYADLLVGVEDYNNTRQLYVCSACREQYVREGG